MDEIHVRTDFPRTVREIENIWIPMPDGVKLAARIWLPEDAEDDPVPAIFEYLPYRKRDGTVARDHLTHPYFAGHGYAGVRVDMRGTGDSEGICLGEYLQQEQDDAVAVIEWLAAQPWCSGKVGMIGISWGGFNGLQVAALQPEALGAVISLCSTDDRYADDIHFMGGAVLADKMNWGATAFPIANAPPDPAVVGQDRWRDMWKERLDNNGLWMLDWFRHQRRDAFWQHGSICEDYAAVQVPVYMVGGWADGYTNPIFRTMEHLNCPRKALIGPWGHKYPHFAKPGPRIGFLQECLRWWDQHLKGIDTGIMAEPQLRAWINDPAPPSPLPDQRPGTWVAEPGWAGKAVGVQSLYLSDGGLGDAPSSDAISLCSPQTAGAASGAWCNYGADPDGPVDQNGELGLMTCFETAPLEEDMSLLGFPMLHAEVASDVPQANLVAVLSAVAEDGTATFITYGVLNLTHRNSHANPEPMPAGVPQPASVQLNVCGQKIAKGQRLRLALSNAYWPVIWPSQSKSTLTLTGTRLDLPVRAAREMDAELQPFARPESATPVPVTTHAPASFERRRIVDYASGEEVYEITADDGCVTFEHIDETVTIRRDERFSIHPDDPNSAKITQGWLKRYARGDWLAELRTEVTMEALPDVWRIHAWLEARDADGVVAERRWAEDVPRDLA
ncbi:MAG: CocE/NonD family hydrolase [Paracoccaceae bacterium]